MAKFSSDDDHALKPAIHFLATIASNALELGRARSRPTIAPPPPPAPVNEEGLAVEDKFSILEDYDTTFLIDDSPSMRGEKWELVQKILNYSTVVATRYDTNGIDVHFMNNIKANQNEVKDPDTAVKIHQNIELRGSTPTRDRLSRHLKRYLQKFEAEDWSAEFKGYNLIVLTDGYVLFGATFSRLVAHFGHLSPPYARMRGSPPSSAPTFGPQDKLLKQTPPPTPQPVSSIRISALD